MLAVSSLFPGFDWEFPISIIGTELEQANNMDIMHFDNDIFHHNFPCNQPQTRPQPQPQLARTDSDRAPNDLRGGSTHSGSSNEDLGAFILAKKCNHNASERERRKKINGLYYSLRALLPNTDHTKKLSIPTTISRVLKYIPELQKEVEELIHKKDELLSKVSKVEEATKELISQGNNQKKGKNIQDNLLSSIISVNKLGEREIVVQISAYQRLQLAEVLLLLENDGLLVIDVSSSQSFGGRGLYNIHLLMEGTTIFKDQLLTEKLLSLIHKHG